ncbi:NAD-dependent epimerase/dehydratase family protein [Shimia sp. MMG029]|uniref:NAD-dependent epimerase/dehydratase family protein n=1 Tax=Shimia sp. MMG029 TaxID=3021978 RepID=UPI0022FDC3AB|nr:NAD(P)-dependent oxidoreductase [Shimia sp. MMG029]MDA5556948.1 NAD(P)-dependent oxidoreductase [Shimia sp. MMG029]
MPKDDYVLVTGAAGFIGHYLVNRLAGEHRLVCLDSFDPQIHDGKRRTDETDILEFDIATDDFSQLDAYGKPKAIIHLAAKTGTGQSMYELENYYKTNITGSARVLDFALKNQESMQHFLFASSRSIYGEGLYSCQECNSDGFLGQRLVENLRENQFEVKCPSCGSNARAIATTENCAANSASHYALTKAATEQAISIAFANSDVTHCSLRFQNVYGIGQSLNNPYTGVLGIFASLARKGQDISVYEKGKISRDFVSVVDIAEILKRSLEKSELPASLNVGTGIAQPLKTVAQSMVSHYKSRSDIHVTNAFRFGDIATNFADLTRFRSFFGQYDFRKFDDELPAYLDWVADMGGMDMNKFDASVRELRKYGIYSE